MARREATSVTMLYKVELMLSRYIGCPFLQKNFLDGPFWNRQWFSVAAGIGCVIGLPVGALLPVQAKKKKSDLPSCGAHIGGFIGNIIGGGAAGLSTIVGVYIFPRVNAFSNVMIMAGATTASVVLGGREIFTARKDRPTT
ncbi:MAG: hypothetical protein JSR80_03700 [Verrucomicrobia bacterium]|nr:hypothetical protein [Verrucomicrobiota bacterium]